jgi:hypothetical protein
MKFVMEHINKNNRRKANSGWKRKGEDHLATSISINKNIKPTYPTENRRELANSRYF